MSVSNGSSTISPFYKGAIAGAFAGGVEGAINFPLFTIKTRYQDCKIPAGSKFTLKPAVLYRGYSSFFMAVVPNRALQAGGTETVRAVMRRVKGKEHLRPDEMFLSACLGGSSSAIVSGPAELVIARQTADRGFLKTMKSMIKIQGVGSLTIGIYGTAMRNGLFTGGYLGVAPLLKELLPESLAPMSGLGAGIGAAICSQPFDTLKTRQQTDPENMKGRHITSLWKIAQRTFQLEGWRGFYLGGSARVLRVITATSILSEADSWFRKSVGWK